jgi:ribose transport system permease protein
MSGNRGPAGPLVNLEPQTARGAPAAAPVTGRRGVLLRDYSVALAVVALVIVLSMLSPAFLTKANLLNVLDQSVTLGIVACGATLVIIAGGFDLSAGAVFAISGVIAAYAALHVGVGVGILAGIAVGPLIGLGNGLLVATLSLNSFLATLASSLAIRGLAVAISGGFLLSVTDSGFGTLGKGSLLDVRYAVWILIAFAIVSIVLLHATKYGRYVFAIGGNAEAARLSGIPVDRVRIMTFAFSGLAASIAGVLATSRIATGQADVGAGLELTAIAAVVLGGTSILGGAGAIWRTIVGVMLLALINNGFNILNVEPSYQNIATGAIIVVAVALNTLAGRK